MTQDLKNRQQLLYESAPVMDLVAQFWLHEIDAQLAASWNQHLAPLAAKVFQTAPADIHTHQFEELAVEFCRLFVGPANHLPPIQSVWETGQLEGPATKSMQLYITRMGIRQLSNLPADHLGVQLQTLAVLSRTLGDVDDVNVVDEFRTAHLRWTDRLFDAAERAAGEVYASLVRLTRKLISDLADEA